MVFGCANLATPHTNTFLCLLLKIFNVESKCNYKCGNSKFMALRYKKTLLMTLIMSPSMLDLRCFVNFKIVFCPICSFVVSSFLRLHSWLLCSKIAPTHVTLCKVPISLTIEPLWMFKWSILKTFMTCLQTMHCATRGQLYYGHSEVGACTIHIFP